MWKNVRSFFTFRCCKSDSLGRYTIIKQIGEGSTSKVFKTQNVSTYKFYTCKRFPKHKMESAQRESHILRRMDNIYLPRYHKFYFDDYFAYLFIDYINGTDLFNVFTEQMRGSIKKEEELKNIVRQMLFCLNACHKIHIQHLDVKLENFIVTERDPIRLKIIDFGHAHYFFNNCRSSLYCAVGTYGYSAPEIKNIEFHKTSDIWSLGICAWILATGEKPFYINIETQRYDYTFPMEKHLQKMKKMTPLLGDFFISIFQSCPERRITMRKLIRHKWFDYSL